MRYQSTVVSSDWVESRNSGKSNVQTSQKKRRYSAAVKEQIAPGEWSGVGSLGVVARDGQVVWSGTSWGRCWGSG